jgi:ribulose kinase
MVREVGEAVGLLGSQAAGELGLPAGLPVAACLIDAHAGALALLALPSRSPQWSRLALIAGTSTCAILLSPEPVEVPGVWGPYWGPVVPSMYALEAGESATGALLEYLLRGHPAAARLGEPLERLVPRLNELLHHMAARRALPLGLLARDRHILPYFHGNRSPRADPQLRGMIAGLTLQEDIEDLAVTYLACLQALAYGVRHICAALRERGLEVRELCLGGGLARNPLFVQCLADGASLPCIMLAPDRAEAMLLGAAMVPRLSSSFFSISLLFLLFFLLLASEASCFLSYSLSSPQAGAAASQLHADVGTGMTAMAGSIEGVRCVQPSEDETVSSFHEAKYEIFLAMHVRPSSFFLMPFFVCFVACCTSHPRL